MGTITERHTSKNVPRYMASVRIAGQKDLTVTVDTPEQAQAFIDSVEPALKAAAANRREEEKAESARRAATPKIYQYREEKLGEAIKAFVLTPRCSQRDKKTAKGLTPKLGEILIGEVGEDWTESFIERLLLPNANGKKPYAYSTIESYMQLVTRALKWKARQYKVDAAQTHFSVLRHFPKNWQNRRTRRLSPEEEQMIRDHFCKSDDPAREWWLLLLDVALQTGARLQEMTLAEKSEFNVGSRVWSMPAEHTKKRTARFVALTTDAQAAAARLVKLAKPGEARLFHAIRDAKQVSAKFRQVFKKLGIVDLRPHDFRHEAISRMVEKHRNVQVFEIMQMVGHKKTETLNSYSHGRADQIALRMS